MSRPRSPSGGPDPHAATEPPPVRTVGPNELRVGRLRRPRLHFTGCDYLRLSRHPAVIAAHREAAARYGLGVAASRTTTGNHPLYRKLELALARFSGAESALLVGAGYLANLAVAQALAGEAGAVLIDEQAHPALADAAPCLGAPVIPCPHLEPAAIGRALRKGPRRARPLVLTDGLFPLTGETAPLGELLERLPANGLLLVDDAHGLGTLGPRGAGTASACGAAVAKDPRLLRTTTLSKALGSFGGAILGPATFIRAVRERSRLFRGSTPPPLPAVAAALEALRVIRREPDRLRRLRKITRRAKAGFGELGFPQPANDAPILALTPAEAAQAGRLTTALDRAGIHAPPVAYPGDPAPVRFRFAISSEHTAADLDRLLSAVRSAVAAR